MTKVANANCVAFFTLIASATDCAGVSISNNSPYGVNNGSNASGNYPVGVTTVLFTATDGCGNISTMDVVITVTDPNPTTFMCEKQIVYLPEETEITLSARIFVVFMKVDVRMKMIISSAIPVQIHLIPQEYLIAVMLELQHFHCGSGMPMDLN